jgi:hypothetical protein
MVMANEYQSIHDIHCIKIIEMDGRCDLNLKRRAQSIRYFRALISQKNLEKFWQSLVIDFIAKSLPLKDEALCRNRSPKKPLVQSNSAL